MSRAAALASLVAALCSVACCAALQAETAPRATIRVGVWTLWRDREVGIASAAAFKTEIRLCENCLGRPMGSLAVRAGDAGLVWTEGGGRLHAAAALWIDGNYRLAAHGESLTLAYPLKIVASRGALLLAATVPVERYVELAVAAESGAADGLESRKALAVAARSFALQPSHGHAGFDVCDSTHCQWVHWRSTPEAHQAALATAGASLWFHGHRAEAYFHRNCGGRTAAAAEVWPGRTQQGYLASRTDDYCSRAGSSEWTTTLTRSELTQALAAEGLAAPGWAALTVSKRGESGRAVLLRAGSVEMPAESFRLAVGRSLGWNRIRSNWFEIAPQGDNYLFHGRGSGHGVGLCQAGAARMAQEGRSYREIIAQYFPGATVAEVTTGSPWQTLAGQGFTLETSDSSDAAYLPALASALAAAESRSGLIPREPIQLRAYRSTPAFRDATLAPGWVAAFTEGDRIALQPLRTLAARKLLDGTLRHEFLHALVEAQTTARTPLWLREGLVEAWAADASRTAKPEITVEEADRKLVRSANLAESEAAHQAAGRFARRLLDRYGRAQVLDWLRSGVPQNALGEASR